MSKNTFQDNATIMTGLYIKIFNFIFSKCKPLKYNDLAFLQPEEVAISGIELSEEEKRLVVSFKHQDGYTVSTESGKLTGFIGRHFYLPIYELHIKIGNKLIKRRIFPQCTHRRINGKLTINAKVARRGRKIMYITDCDSNTFVGIIRDGKPLCL